MEEEEELLNAVLPPQPPTVLESSKIYKDDEGNELIEVEVDENPPDTDDDASTVWGTEIGDDQSEVEEYESLQMQFDTGVDMSISTFSGHGDSVYCTAIHPSIPGLVITGGGDDNGYLWRYCPINPSDTIDGSKPNGIVSVFELAGHTDTVSCVGFNFDGTFALTGSFDGTCRIWNVSTGEQHIVLEGPEDIEWAEWHPKGNAVVAGSSDGTVWLWLTDTGQCVMVFAGHDGKVACGMFSKDGKHVVTGGDDGTVRIWNPKTGVCKHVFEGHFAHEGAVTCMSGSVDGDSILTGNCFLTFTLKSLILMLIFSLKVLWMAKLSYTRSRERRFSRA